MSDTNDIASLNSKLFYAAQHNNLHDVKYFLHKGANINARYYMQDITLLMFAIIKGYKEIAFYLIDNGANIHEKSYNENTAFDYTIDKLNTEIAVYLEKKGAHLVLERKKHYFFFFNALVNEKEEILNILSKDNKKLKKFLYEYRKEVDIEKKNKLFKILTKSIDWFGTI